MKIDGEYAHPMVLNIVHPSGIEEWVCTLCSRRLLMDWSNNSLTILESGDTDVRHTIIKPPSERASQDAGDDAELKDIMDAVRKFLESGEYE